MGSASLDGADLQELAETERRVKDYAEKLKALQVGQGSPFKLTKASQPKPGFGHTGPFSNSRLVCGITRLEDATSSKRYFFGNG